ncbi:hypothetical protein [Rhizobium leguminosarum]|uniref:hypothetical protein n=1 Tax=Rhizobium leguminosarum TaxID=384 RepID=UPI0019FCA644|nr:hypothetical protein [Rhizobium leguminosarum]NKM04217.1 hypothetical protein [Rhizobium leguminosarum bv. viciae]
MTATAVDYVITAAGIDALIAVRGGLQINIVLTVGILNTVSPFGTFCRPDIACKVDSKVVLLETFDSDKRTRGVSSA